MSDRNPHDPYWPRFLTPRAYDPHEHEDWLRRAAYAYPSIVRFQSADRQLLLNTGYGQEPFTVELACEWAERLCDAVL